METNTKRSLSTVLQLIDVIVSSTPRNIRCKHIALLLQIAKHSGLTVSELTETMPAYSLASIAKLIREMTHESWRKDQRDRTGIRRLPGFGLVRLEDDPRDHRVKRVFLSEKGERLIHDIIQIHQGDTNESGHD